GGERGAAGQRPAAGAWGRRTPGAAEHLPVRHPGGPARRPAGDLGHRRDRRPGGPGDAQRGARRLRPAHRGLGALRRGADDRGDPAHRLRPADRPPPEHPAAAGRPAAQAGRRLPPVPGRFPGEL
ncbi:MAG: hypothetical protein AVDCRST_MAG41-3316, partial [uncultured Corynebacteriales bacterium]